MTRFPTLGADLSGGLRGVLRLSMGRADGILAMRLDPPGIRRSFVAAAICLPVFLLLHWVDWSMATPRPPLWHLLAVQLAGFAIGWAGFLLICRNLLQALGHETRWPLLVAVWNWCNVAEHGLWLASMVPVVLHAGDVAIEVASLVTIGWALWLEWFALRLVLGMSGVAVAGIVALDVTVGLLVDSVTSAITG